MRNALLIKLKNALLTRDTTYRFWYEDNDFELPSQAQEWSSRNENLDYIFFGMAWNSAVVQKECNVTDEQLTTYRETMTKATAMQFIAYYLAVGPTRVAKCPHEMVIQFVFLCNLKELHTFVTLARNHQDLIAGIADVSDPQQEKGYYNQTATNIDLRGVDPKSNFVRARPI